MASRRASSRACLLIHHRSHGVGLSCSRSSSPCPSVLADGAWPSSCGGAPCGSPARPPWCRTDGALPRRPMCARLGLHCVRADGALPRRPTCTRLGDALPDSARLGSLLVVATPHDGGLNAAAMPGAATMPLRRRCTAGLPRGPALPRSLCSTAESLRFKENLHVMPEATKQHHRSEVAIPCATSKQRSRAGWMSKERSTPEGINLEEHAHRFQFPFPGPSREEEDLSMELEIFSGPPVVMKKRKPPEVRNALREKRVAARQRVAHNHAEVALRKYNRANNTKFELVEIRVISIFFEFGAGCIHYNFTAKQPVDDQNFADAGSTKLFFSEVDYSFRNENDVLLCCIVEEKDAGHCYGCVNYRPVVHPSSQAYGRGSSTCIDYPLSDGDSRDSD